ncbi:hypothetical protein ACA910_011339 [Epithemia clementina (nom. ined.)]
MVLVSDSSAATNAREAQFLRRQEERLQGLQVQRQEKQQRQQQQQFNDNDQNRNDESNDSNNSNNNDNDAAAAGSTRTVQHKDEANWFQDQLKEWNAKVSRLVVAFEQGDEAKANSNQDVPSSTTVLSAITAMNFNSYAPSSSQRRQRIRDICWQIGHLQQELLELRRQFLASRLLLEESSTTDFYNVFSSCQTALDEAKEKLVSSHRININGKGNNNKFVFRRYHEAVVQRKLLREQQQKNQPLGENRQAERLSQEAGFKDNIAAKSQTPIQEAAAADARRVHGFRHASIQIYRHRIRITSATTSRTTTTEEGEGNSISNDNDSNDETTTTCTNSSTSTYEIDRPPVVLSNLECCHVSYCLDETESDDNDNNAGGNDVNTKSSGKAAMALSNVHIVNCQDLVVDFGGSTSITATSGTGQDGGGGSGGVVVVLKALHVTNCTNCTFENGQTQQMRLHESSSLQIRNFEITAGAILEGCRHVQFFVVHEDDDDDDDDLHRKIRDFDWLKPGMPSPNFTIIATTASSSTATPVPPLCTLIAGQTRHGSDPNQRNNHDAGVGVTNNNGTNENGLSSPSPQQRTTDPLLLESPSLVETREAANQQHAAAAVNTETDPAFTGTRTSDYADSDEEL